MGDVNVPASDVVDMILVGWLCHSEESSETRE